LDVISPFLCIFLDMWFVRQIGFRDFPTTHEAWNQRLVQYGVILTIQCKIFCCILCFTNVGMLYYSYPFCLNAPWVVKIMSSPK
jgi:hypothetical protein